MEPPTTALTVATALALMLLFAAAAPAAAALDPTAIRQVLESAMRCQSMRELHAVAVHRNTELFSLRLELQPDGQVRDIPDARLLYLASVSKGMFGTALIRVEQHLRDRLGNQSFSLFDTPVKQLIGDKDFWFLDHGRTELATIDDFLSHRTGLARHDAMWYLFDWPNKQELVRHTSRLNGSADFRNSFLYNNLVWTVADVAVQQLLANSSFVNYMRQFLWHPLDMRDTHGSSELQDTPELMSRLDLSRHHRPLGLPLDASMMSKATRFVEAAGGILTTLSDMTKYMKMHASRNYSAYGPAPGQYRPLNALAAEAGMNAFFNKQFYNDDVTDLPDWEVESYGRGWMRTWYRDHLDYSHGGSLLGVRCELDVFPKQNWAIFNHMTLGPAEGAPFQTFYSAIINKYIADLLIRNESFVTKDNVCALLKNASSPDTSSIPRRHLTDGEVSALIGSYGNYGFGTVAVEYNQTVKTLSLRYGMAVVELIPVVIQQSQEPYFFYINLLEPVEYANSAAVLNRTDDAIFVPSASQQSPQSYATARRGAEGAMTLQVDALEMQLERGLDPGTWRRPKLCPEVDDNKSAAALASSPFACAAAAAAVAVAAALLRG